MTSDTERSEQLVKDPTLADALHKGMRSLTVRERARRTSSYRTGRQRKASRDRTREQRAERLAFDRKRAMYAVATGQVSEATEAAVRNARRAIEAVVLPQLEQLPEERRDAAREQLVPWLQA